MAEYGYGLLRRAGAFESVIGGMRRFLERCVDTMSGHMAWHFTATIEAHSQMFEQLRDSLERGAMIPRSKRLVDELAGLRRTDVGRVEAGPQTKDDLAFSAGIANRIWLQNVIAEIEDAVAPRTPPANAPRHVGESTLRTFLGGLRQQETVVGVTARPRAPGR